VHEEELRRVESVQAWLDALAPLESNLDEIRQRLADSDQGYVSVASELVQAKNHLEEDILPGFKLAKAIGTQAMKLAGSAQECILTCAGHIASGNLRAAIGSAGTAQIKISSAFSKTMATGTQLVAASDAAQPIRRELVDAHYRLYDVVKSNNDHELSMFRLDLICSYGVSSHAVTEMYPALTVATDHFRSAESNLHTIYGNGRLIVAQSDTNSEQLAGAQRGVVDVLNLSAEASRGLVRGGELVEDLLDILSDPPDHMTLQTQLGEACSAIGTGLGLSRQQLEDMNKAIDDVIEQLPIKGIEETCQNIEPQRTALKTDVLSVLTQGHDSMQALKGLLQRIVAQE